MLDPYIRINQYNNNITFYFIISNYYFTALQGLNHGEKKDNDYPIANKKDTQALNKNSLLWFIIYNEYLNLNNVFSIHDLN